jgi:hypothetical protein
MREHFRNSITAVAVALACVGCSRQPIEQCPRFLPTLSGTEPLLPDLPRGRGIYQGNLDATYVVDKSGATSHISVDASGLLLDRKPINRRATEEYAISSLRKRKFHPRSEPCVVKLSVVVN